MEDITKEFRTRAYADRDNGSTMPEYIRRGIIRISEAYVFSDISDLLKHYDKMTAMIRTPKQIRAFNSARSEANASSQNADSEKGDQWDRAFSPGNLDRFSEFVDWSVLTGDAPGDYFTTRGLGQMYDVRLEPIEYIKKKYFEIAQFRVIDDKQNTIPAIAVVRNFGGGQSTLAQSGALAELYTGSFTARYDIAFTAPGKIGACSEDDEEPPAKPPSINVYAIRKHRDRDKKTEFLEPAPLEGLVRV
jgi:hypothetical protein